MIAFTRNAEVNAIYFILSWTIPPHTGLVFSLNFLLTLY